jgi:hypothetical protein
VTINAVFPAARARASLIIAKIRGNATTARPAAAWRTKRSAALGTGQNFRPKEFDQP